MKNPYENIIHLPHHVSEKRPHMSMPGRAAQFAPYAALVGYGDAVSEAGRYTEDRIELDTDRIAELDAQLRYIADNPRNMNEVTFTCFVPDERKSGGAYVKISGTVSRIDTAEGCVVLSDGRRININDIYDVRNPSYRHDCADIFD